MRSFALRVTWEEEAQRRKQFRLPIIASMEARLS